MVKRLIDTISPDVQNYLYTAEYGSHYIVIYPDMNRLREIYSAYVKKYLTEVKKEIVVIFPYYETTDTVRRILSEDNACIDVRKHEKEGSLVIIDSVKAYFGSSVDIISFVKTVIDYAKQVGKSGVSVLADMGSFYHYNKINELVEYETSCLPSKFNTKLRAFCMYHKADYERLNKQQKQKLLEHHGKHLVITHYRNI